MIRPVSGAAAVGNGRGGPRDPGGFSVGRGGAPAAAPIAPAQPVGLGGMLALQEAPGGVEDREARRRGQDLLEALAGLQRAMLGLDGGDLGRLARLAEEVPQAQDPALREAVAAIVLRARVEAARLEVAKAALGPGMPDKTTATS